ncbi:STAS domain-containing protein [Halomonas qinghailakensis]|uniref:STAS domain-containing protein n=1 Tax=Halomonas qinghailakensis TaxID=2937790 RepID=A0AA46TPF3_9GAMM|nr:STAS domain-containing protein [Halomonas sp. ZZQ-149]UYO74116.1 STAS domain-containing protein [Halomonas sp. ZZQ-149]
MTTLLSTSHVSLIAQANTLSVNGDLTVNAAADVAAVGVKWLESAQLTEVTLDFFGVTRASSAAISVLFEWLRACHLLGVVVTSIMLSAPLERLTSLAELDALIKSPNTEA